MMMPPRRERRKKDLPEIVMTVLCVICTVLTVLVFAPTVLDTSDRADTNTKQIHDIAVLTRANAKLTRQIQDERTRNVVVNCRETNRRHDATIRKLDELVAATSGADRARAQANRAGTVALLEAIVPHRNCRALVRRQVPSNNP